MEIGDGKALMVARLEVGVDGSEQNCGLEIVELMVARLEIGDGGVLISKKGVPVD